MMKSKAAFFVLTLTTALNQLQAQYSMNSLDEVLEYAIVNNSENKIKQLQVEKAIHDKNASNSYLLPTISATGNGQYNIDITQTPVPGDLLGRPGETVYMEFGKKYNYSAGIHINYKLLDWQSMYSTKMAKVNIELKNAEKDYFEQTLKEQVAQFYYASLTSQTAVEIGQMDLAISDTVLMLTKQSFKEGTIDAIALNQNIINFNSMSQNLESTKQYYNECIANLKILIGLEAAGELILTEDISNKKTFISSFQSIQNIRYTEIYRLHELYSETAVKEAKTAFIPQIGLHAYSGYNQFHDDFSVSFNSRDWRPENYIAVSVNIPIFTGFANKAKYVSAKIDNQIASESYNEEFRKTSINDSILFTKISSSALIASISYDNYMLSAQNINLALQKYKQGLLALDTYLNIFNDYLNTENLYLNYLSEFLINKASIESKR